MTISHQRRPNAAAGRLAALLLAAATPVMAGKDVGPAGTCDRFAPGDTAWKTCVGAAASAQNDAELFYAGYWLAKTGNYGQALDFLNRAKNPDERVLTYMGYATRKLGRVDAALPYYRQALGKNPDFVVARAYLGEAYLSLGERDKARAELSEIEHRAGRASAAWGELAAAIALADEG